jgi:NAD(P)-dependent dehydrogenase (short-subunit alcohol dehydrogenase family)
MCERGFGRVITISSGAGITGLRIGVSPYAAGKGGAIAFMRHLAMENARFGVTANSLALGLMQPENSGPVDALAKQIPVGRTGTPDDVGFGCVYLASNEASWITGQTIHLDGGATFG